MTVPLFRLKCNGAVIATWLPPVAGGAGTAARAFFHVPGGAAVYTIEYQVSPADSAAYIHHRSILVQGVQQT